MRSEKLERYREERRKHLARLDYLQARIKELDQKIVECENLEIRALMKTENMTLADLMALVREMQEQRRNALPDGGSASNYGYVNEEENETNEEI